MNDKKNSLSHRKFQVRYCRICKNRKLESSIGLICGLTDQPPKFEINCAEYSRDDQEADRLVELETQALEADLSDEFDYESFKNGEPEKYKKAKIKAIIIMMIGMVANMVMLTFGLKLGMIILDIIPSILILVSIIKFRNAYIGKMISSRFHPPDDTKSHPKP